jgi:Peptidase family C25
MKKLILLLLIFISVNVFCQNTGSISLDWSFNNQVSYDSFVINTPKFKGDNFQFDLSKMQIKYVLNIPQNGFVNENSLKITNLVYQSISLENLGQLDVSNIYDNIEEKLINIQSRDEVTANISLNPIIKDGNVFKKIISFDYSFENGNLNRILNNFNAISSSVLASGNWYRFYVIKSGAYVINKTFLQQLGIPLGFDPRNFKIYGGGGRMLPHANNIPYPIDLPEIAIQVNGENDGVFNDNDSAIFYAEGVDNWSAENLTFGNLYEDKSYYYINVDGNAGKRMLDLLQPTGVASQTFNIFDDETFYEKDIINIGKLGRKWFGDNFSTNNVQTFNFNIPNTVIGSQMIIKATGAAVSSATTIFSITANGTPIGSFAPSALPVYTAFTESSNNSSFSATENLSLKISYNNQGIPTSQGFLDYISVKSKRNLVGYGKQFRFQNNLSAVSSSGFATYRISNANNINQVWNVTDIYNASKVTNGGLSTLDINSNLGTIQKFIAVDFNDLYSPLKDSNSKIANQDLKGTIFKDSQGVNQDIDYLIITPNFLTPEAEKLANFHRSYNSYNVKVVTLESIYPEFSSGKQDVGAIRNFVKYVYDNNTTKKLQFLNLFGDASYDYKNTNKRTRNNNNIVPIFHALYSSSLSEPSFCSDDFFGLMGNNEGTDNGTFYNGLDIAVGRMIVSTNQQAEQMVNKVIEYYDKKSYGSWRNSAVFIADDADNEDDKTLQVVQNELADEVVLNKPFINLKKIFLDSYSQTATAGGNRYPLVNQDFYNAFQNGSLLIDYLGHGGEDSLTQELIWDKTNAQSLTNQFRYPLFMTITCNFSRFDNPYKVTAGEYTYLNPIGGAIAMLTTVREISKYSAETFNKVLTSKVMSFGTNNYYSVGESLRLAKKVGGNSSSNVVLCVGDPALKIAIPKPKVVLTKVNDMTITGPIDDLKSLGYTKLTGEIVDESNVPYTNYNGELAVNIFDKNISRLTLNNDNQGSIMPFKALGETIFRGNASITNGKFEFGFVVPRDIRIPVDYGRISFYAKQNETLLDNTGVDNNIKIGGVNLLAVADKTPPKARLYMNDETFVNGGITNQSPLFLAFIEDENGINTAAGIGHDIQAVLDGKITIPFILNDYYETELDNYRKGKLKFQFRNLSVGLHTLTFTAYDVYNNIVTQDLQFLVVGNETLTLTNVLNYPNPFVNYTQFWFTHNRPFEQLEVQLQIMTITGKIICTKNQSVNTTGFLSRDISWDGKDDFGDRLGKGVYVYKLTVKSILTDSVTEKYEKLVIL